MDFREMIKHLANTMPIDKEKALKSGGCTLYFQDKLALNIEWEEEKKSDLSL